MALHAVDRVRGTRPSEDTEALVGERCRHRGSDGTEAEHADGDLRVAPDGVRTPHGVALLAAVQVEIAGMTDGRDEREVHEALRLFRVVEAGDREAALGHPALRHHRLGARTEHHDEREAARLLEQAVLGPPREQHLGRLDAFRRGGVTVPHPQQRLGPLETLQPTLAVVRVPGEQSTHRAGYEDIAAARCGELADDRWSGVQRNEVRPASDRNHVFSRGSLGDRRSSLQPRRWVGPFAARAMELGRTGVTDRIPITRGRAGAPGRCGFRTSS
jgi:hypothetical protein